MYFAGPGEDESRSWALLGRRYRDITISQASACSASLVTRSSSARLRLRVLRAHARGLALLDRRFALFARGQIGPRVASLERQVDAQAAEASVAQLQRNGCAAAGEPARASS